MRNAFISALGDIADRNSNVWLLCGDLGYSVLEPFVARMPGRYINIGVAEQNMIGIAAGIALSGKTVFVYSIGNFPTFRCLEQLRNDVCYHGADVKVVAVGGGFAYGNQGYTHHAIEDVAVMTALPRMEVFTPCDPMEVRSVTQLIAGSGRPSYLRLGRAGEPVLHATEPRDPRSPQLLRTGQDGVILASGPIVSACLIASERLAATGLSIGVASVACVKPLDENFVRELGHHTRPIFTVEEHVLRGGLHAAVLASLAAHPRRPLVFGLGIPELGAHIPCAGEREALLASMQLSPEAIQKRITQALESL